MADLRQRPGVAFTTQNGWTVAVDEKAMTMWSFAPAGDPAYPALVRRQVVQEPDGYVSVRMSVLCEAEKAPCDNLVRTFDALNDKVLGRR